MQPRTGEARAGTGVKTVVAGRIRATLRSWGRALRGPLGAQPRSRKRPVAREVELVEVERVVGAHAGAIEIVLTNQRRLLLTAGLTPAEIAELARALEAE